MSVKSLGKLFLLIFFYGAFLNNALGEAENASLSIYPYFVKLSDKDRAAQITALNTGTGRGGYSITLVDMVMDEKGKVMEKEDPKYSIKEYIRLAPKSFSIKPKDKQLLRVLARLPEGVEEGEYRAGIKILLHDKNLDKTDLILQEKMLGISAAVDSKVALLVPMVYYHGKTHYDIEIKNIELIEEINPNGSTKTFSKLILERTGNRSASGIITIDYIDPNGKTHKLSDKRYAIWRSVEKREIMEELKLPENLQISTQGKFKVIYESVNLGEEGEKAKNNEVYKEKEFKVVRLKEYQLNKNN
jgi:P pilus assembly chaperone PapD